MNQKPVLNLSESSDIFCFDLKPFQSAPGPLPTPIAGWMANPSPMPLPAASAGPIGLGAPNAAGILQEIFFPFKYLCT